MEFLTRRLERWLWPPGRADAPRWRLTARFVYALARDFFRGELSLHAMSLVYTTMLAIVPLLAFAFALLKGLGVHHRLEPVLLSVLAPLGPRASELTTRIVGFVDNISGSTLASVSIALLLISALSMAQKVEASFNFVWRVDRPRSFARRFSEYLSVMLVGPLLMSVVMGFNATLASNAIVGRLEQFIPVSSWLAAFGTLTPFLLVIAAFTFLYVFVPNTSVRLKPALIGGLFGGALWAGGGRLFTGFVAGASRTEAIYSGFAVVLVAMLWLYLSWLILLLGAQLAFYVQNPDYLRFGRRTELLSNSLRERLALSVMLLVGRDFERPNHGWRVDGIAARLRVPRYYIEPAVGALTDAGLLTEAAERRLLPAKDLHHIRIVEILDAIRRPASESSAESNHVWSPGVQALAERIERGIDTALGGQSLADFIAADSASADAGAPSAATAPRP